MTTWNRIRHDPPHDNCEWVKIDVYLRRNSDGLVRVYHTDGLLEDDNDTLATYIWEEGNYVCDCNRYLFFQRAIDAPEQDDPPCSRDKYDIWIVNPATNEVVYDERGK